MDFLKEGARKKFAERLRLAVERSGYKQYKIAEKVGVEPPNVSRWLTGKTYPSEENFNKLCDILNVDKSFFETGSLLNNSLDKSDLILRLYTILPGLNESQLGAILALTERLLSGGTLVTLEDLGLENSGQKFKR
jgi:transcriptional regulator with XRE-family HTH domain